MVSITSLFEGATVQLADGSILKGLQKRGCFVFGWEEGIVAHYLDRTYLFDKEIVSVLNSPRDINHYTIIGNQVLDYQGMSLVSHRSTESSFAFSTGYFDVHVNYNKNNDDEVIVYLRVGSSIEVIGRGFVGSLKDYKEAIDTVLAKENIRLIKKGEQNG